jgi:hypothetical protein
MCTTSPEKGMTVKSVERNTRVFVVLVVLLGVACFSPGGAEAAFTRPLLRQITRAANPSSGMACKAGEGPPCLSLSGGFALDAKDDLWVGDANSGGLDEFSPAYAAVEPNAFLKTLAIGAPPNVAIESATSGDYYLPGLGGPGKDGEDVEVLSSTGALVETWGEFAHPYIAIDNSTEPLTDPAACSLSECTVYVSSVEGGDRARLGINKLDSKGVPVEFSDAKKCEAEKCGYIEGNRITGVPSTPPIGRCSTIFTTGGDQEALTTDADGDIYLAASCGGVLEYRPSGEFVRAFSLESEEALFEGKAGSPINIAVDPVSDHLLVTVVAEKPGGNMVVGAVDEFEAATGKFVSQITETSVGTQLGRPIGMSVDSHGDVYVLDSERKVVDVWGPGVYSPSLELGLASERTGTSAVLNGSVDPEGLKLLACDFQYVTEAAFQENVKAHNGLEAEGFSDLSSGGEEACSPQASTIPITGTTSVSAPVSGLAPGGTYRYRLVASSEGALGGSAHTSALAFTAPAAPGILSSSVSNISSTFADLDARIDPLGAVTSYRFEYLTAAAFAADGESFSGPDPTVSAPVPDESIGLGGPAGDTVESVSEHIGPLAAGTTYYYRVVATNGQGVTSGAVCGGKLATDCAFATLPEAVPGLPDGRAYELVTPDDKQGGSDMFTVSEFEREFTRNGDSTGTPSLSGEGFLLEAFSLFGPFPGAGHAAYVFHRDPQKGEWAYTALTEPSLGTQSALNALFDPVDLSRVGINDAVGSTLDGAGEQFTNLVGSPGGTYVKLHVDPSKYEAGNEAALPATTMVGASLDLSHVVLVSDTPGGQANVGCPGSEGVKHGHAICEWSGGDETLEDGEVKPALKLVNVNSEGELLSACGAQLGSETAGGTQQAVSADGSRVFFIAPDSGTVEKGPPSGPGCWNGGTVNAPQLYARIGGTSTLDVSEPEPGVSEPGSKEPHERPVLYRAEFMGASEDGRKVFFVTESWLTANHPQVHDLELYECEITEQVVKEKMVPRCKLTRISAPGAPGITEGGGLFGVQAVASEGTAVYFLAFGALAPGASKLKVEKVDSGTPVNLYRYQTETATTPAKMTYVATVSTNNRSNQPLCDGSFAPCTEENWYTTPDGRYLLFSSEVDLTANAHAGGSCEVLGSQGIKGICGALYRYDAHAAEGHEPSIVCVSCDPGGGTPSGNAQFTRSSPRNLASAPVRAMSEDGSYVFFDTPTPLLPGATNGTLDVYEWHDGRISLISSGAQAGPSYFLGYSPYVTPGGETVEGGNVFIGTHARLVPQDTNKVGNIYDARICVAESPCIKPPPGETAQCEGASCQSSPVEPLDATPTSLSFSGPGDILSEPSPAVKTVQGKAAVKCRKGTVRKKGKCVKKPKEKAKKRAKKSARGSK